ncbi:MAG: dihydropteroate synthase [Gemmatimonadota bacterium]|nr:dihydropteroate synthase [Gemmatimonadota bacterium]
MTAAPAPATAAVWAVRGRTVTLDRPRLLGILNVTPDSFSDGGLWLEPARAVDHALVMAKEGADIVDIGGESTRPGAQSVGLKEELERVLPVIRDLRRRRPGLALSIDTTKAEVARQAVAAGACLINDVSALTADPAMLAVVEGCDAGLCIMHRLEAPPHARWSTDEGTRYGPAGVSAEVLAWLREHLESLRAAGVAEERVWLDPGIGFGKALPDNLRLLKELGRLAALGRPLVVGVSRKSFIGKVLGVGPVDERLEGTLAACAAALMNGAGILRVHDVKAAVRVATMVRAIQTA